MPANQQNAALFNPNALNLTRVATYERLIRAPEERVWENVLDWEHLPWLHKTSFGYIELDEAGEWGWRTWSNPEHTAHIELTRGNDSCYVARSYNADSQVSEIWTTVTVDGDNTQIAVEFHFPEVDPQRSGSLHDAILKLYTQLWDEDEAMMIERHRRLVETRELSREINLGTETAIYQKLSGGDPVIFQLARREYQLREVIGELHAHTTICPHLSGPLSHCVDQDGQLTCPWHGYRFDIQSGECVFPKSAACHLPPAPTITIEQGDIIARSSAQDARVTS